ncbi:MAG: hypothetical protein IKV50_07800 [Clostridia bacterium]|nr:hypothetical protein [Clostridia bacterium]MBR6553638.1 hypothetical protein [Clostridia bacterium]
MKKNMMMRLASVLLIAVLMSTCAISGTFAKYVTSDTAQDSARVAKWGVTVNVEGESFAKAYDGDTVTFNTVVSSNNDDLLAPGTQGNMGSISVTGTPEVAVNIVVDVELELTGWEIGGVEYCPLVFTVGGTDYKINGSDIKTVDDLEDAVETAFEALSANGVAANTNLARSVSGTWAWSFEGDDVKDTALGDLAVAPTISFTCTTTVTQID